MELTLTVETKMIGQKKAGDRWLMPLSPSDSEQLLLRDLIARIVRTQVAVLPFLTCDNSWLGWRGPCEASSVR